MSRKVLSIYIMCLEWFLTRTQLFKVTPLSKKWSKWQNYTSSDGRSAGVLEAIFWRNFHFCCNVFTSTCRMTIILFTDVLSGCQGMFWVSISCVQNDFSCAHSCLKWIYCSKSEFSWKIVSKHLQNDLLKRYNFTILMTFLTRASL